MMYVKRTFLLPATSTKMLRRCKPSISRRLAGKRRLTEEPEQMPGVDPCENRANAPLVGAIKLMALGAVLGAMSERLPSLLGMREVL